MLSSIEKESYSEVDAANIDAANSSAVANCLQEAVPMRIIIRLQRDTIILFSFPYRKRSSQTVHIGRCW